MRTEQDVVRDIKAAPYRDFEGAVIFPGSVLMVDFGGDNQTFVCPTTIIDGELCFAGQPLDDVLEATNKLLVVGRVH